jgi:AcrR family transcriptional regulator
VIEQSPKHLPRGRSALSRDEVERIHRDRLCRAMAEAMAKSGYAGTSVKDVLDRAGVSRRDFYHLFRSKFECFLAAFAAAREILLGRMLEGAGVESIGQLGAADDPVGRFGSAISAYLSAVAEELPVARLFLVESYAAGADAVRLRMEAQDAIADVMASLMRVTGPAGRSTCAMVVAAVSSKVTGLLAVSGAGDIAGEDKTGDDKTSKVREEILALGPQVAEDVRRLWQAGAFAEPSGAGIPDPGE